jgi:hypothetical protein
MRSTKPSILSFHLCQMWLLPLLRLLVVPVPLLSTTPPADLGFSRWSKASFPSTRATGNAKTSSSTTSDAFTKRCRSRSSMSLRKMPLHLMIHLPPSPLTSVPPLAWVSRAPLRLQVMEMTKTMMRRRLPRTTSRRLHITSPSFSFLVPCCQGGIIYISIIYVF